MASTIEVLFCPAEYDSRRNGGFDGSACVVFDVLRATSVMVTGLAHGSAGFVPVEEIAEALQLKIKYPEALLAGERNGLRITAELSGGVDFDLGNSPHEYDRDKVRGRKIISTTTNGTRALRACSNASTVMIASFLNLDATARWLTRSPLPRITMVCAGTAKFTALEDVLCAGALIDELPGMILEDSAMIARSAFHASKNNLLEAIANSRNGRRLMDNEELKSDVEFCLRRDAYDFPVVLGTDGVVKKA